MFFKSCVNAWRLWWLCEYEGGQGGRHAGVRWVRGWVGRCGMEAGRRALGQTKRSVGMLACGPCRMHACR